MTVEDVDVVDFIGIDDATQTVVLTIADNLTWTKPLEHTYVLQEKLNRYVAFVESGELYESFPNARGRKVRIDVIGRYEPVEVGEQFYRHAAVVLRQADVELKFRLFSGE